MSSILRNRLEPTCLNMHFSVHTYSIPDSPTPPATNIINCFFTVNNNSLYRMEYDLSGTAWVIARDLGTQRIVDTIDSNLLTYWSSFAGWTNIRVIQSGIARKFQVVSVPYGDRNVGYYDTVVGINQSQYNDGAYEIGGVSYIYNGTNDNVNEMLIVGRDSTTVHTPLYQNLPYGIFWALTKPLIIQYIVGGTVYQRAIRHKITEVNTF